MVSLLVVAYYIWLCPWVG